MVLKWGYKAVWAKESSKNLTCYTERRDVLAGHLRREQVHVLEKELTFNFIESGIVYPATS